MTGPRLVTSLVLVLTAAALLGCQTATSPAPLATQPRRTAPALGPTSTASQPSEPAGTHTSPAPSLAPVPTPSSRDWQRGLASAPVTLVAYMDFQCTPCNAAALSISNAFLRHPQLVRQVYRPFPLSKLEDKADLAAALVEAAGRQNAFWPMHDLLVNRYIEWRSLAPDSFSAWAIQASVSLGVDPVALEQALDDPDLNRQISERYAESQASGIPGAPFVLLNGRPFLLAGDETQLEAAVRLAILQAEESSRYPGMELETGRDYQATIRTNLGEIRMQLYSDTAPFAVNSFVHLARQGWYAGTGAYQVAPGQWIGVGDPTWTGLGDAGYHYPVEIDASRSFDRSGMVGVIPTGPQINGSRFFVGLIPLPEYDGTHTVLGRITEGMDILASLTQRSPLDDLLTPPDLTIQSIAIEPR